MNWSAAIDRHSSTNVTVVMDEPARGVEQKRVANELAGLLQALAG